MLQLDSQSWRGGEVQFLPTPAAPSSLIVLSLISRRFHFRALDKFGKLGSDSLSSAPCTFFRSFSIVVLDEASQMVEPASLLSVGRCVPETWARRPAPSRSWCHRSSRSAARFGLYFEVGPSTPGLTPVACSVYVNVQHSLGVRAFLGGACALGFRLADCSLLVTPSSCRPQCPGLLCASSRPKCLSPQSPTTRTPLSAHCLNALQPLVCHAVLRLRRFSSVCFPAPMYPPPASTACMCPPQRLRVAQGV